MLIIIHFIIDTQQHDAVTRVHWPISAGHWARCRGNEDNPDGARGIEHLLEAITSTSTSLLHLTPGL